MSYSKMHVTRLISENDEKIFRSVHHDFGGNGAKETARIMGISEASVYRALARVRAVAPSFFPILGKTDIEVLRNYNAGLCYEAIAHVCRISLSAVKRRVASLKEKGIIKAMPSAKTVRYSADLDNQVERKF